jgi:hypothetical protein
MGRPSIDTTVVEETEDDLYAQLEGGSLRENISDDCLSPAKSQKEWQQYTMKKLLVDGAASERCYELYDASTGDFALSARKKNGSFEISRYRIGAENRRSNFCAILRPEGNYGFQLLSCGCECCDKHLSRFSCEGITNPAINFHNKTDQHHHHHYNHLSPSAGSQTREGRQVLATIFQRLAVEEKTGTEMRALEVELPALIKPDQKSHLRPKVPTSPAGKGLERVVWCPRSPRRVGSDTCSSATSEAARFVTKLPHFSDEVGCLTMDFATERVKEASTKNFVLVEQSQEQKERDFGPSHEQITGPGRLDDADIRRPVLQFGKEQNKSYAVDMRHPIAPVQAFGVCLAMCIWRLKGEQLKESSL